MKHLKKYNESFDLELAITKIKEHFSEESVCQMFDEEVLEWVDDDWSDESESEYDWYMDHNNGEAQDVVIDQIIDWYKKDHELDSNSTSTLIDEIKSEYNCLNY